MALRFSLRTLLVTTLVVLLTIVTVWQSRQLSDQQQRIKTLESQLYAANNQFYVFTDEKGGGVDIGLGKDLIYQVKLLPTTKLKLRQKSNK